MFNIKFERETTHTSKNLPTYCWIILYCKKKKKKNTSYLGSRKLQKSWYRDLDLFYFLQSPGYLDISDDLINIHIE